MPQDYSDRQMELQLGFLKKMLRFNEEIYIIWYKSIDLTWLRGTSKVVLTGGDLFDTSTQ